MIAIRALGPIEISVDGHAAPAELLWRKNLGLLVYLARSPRRGRSREHLMGLLWGDRPESAARHSLREAVRILRHAGGEGLLEAEGDQVRLAEGAVQMDVDQFEAQVEAGDWARAAALAAGDFLEGFGIPDAAGFEDWLHAERTTLRRRAVDALVRHADLLAGAGDLEASGACAERALQLEPLSEGAARALISALALRGERAAALAAFEACGARLREALGAEPGEATARLAERVRRERAWAAPVREARGAESRRAPLIGRDEELVRLLGVWAGVRAGHAAMALIEGPPGAGRTRLVEEVAARTRLDGAAATSMRATPADRSEPWSGVIGLARGGLLDATGVAGAAPEALATFAARCEEWGDRFPAARNGEARTPGTALREVVRAAASEQPLVLVVDDAQWLDAESLAALDALARDAADLPVLLLTTAATQPAREEVDHLRARLGRDVPGVTITLEPLGPAALAQLARWAMPGWSAVEIDRLARRLAADSAGLPLLAVELLHAVALGLDLHGTPRAWPEPERTLDQSLPGAMPESVTAAVRIGFRRLSKDAQTVLAAAAVLGDRVEAASLARATELAPDGVAAALDEAEWHRWLAADGRGYTFVARVARDIVARDMLTGGQRRRLLDRLTQP